MHTLSPTDREMVQALKAFKHRHGHCRVPTAYAENPRLGRWVASRRYRRKVGDLAPELIAALDALGFVWRPNEADWNRMYTALKAFKQHYGHCNVPEHLDENPQLANWVQSQRHRRRQGKLSARRILKLDALEFTWAVYRDRKRTGRAAHGDAARAPRSQDAAPPEERLYALRSGVYVQYDGNGQCPPALAAYLEQHNGRFPPYIPLPQEHTVFRLGVRHVREKHVSWPGKGPLPQDVLNYVSRSGTLPPQA
ncbi:MAG: helicase associated domain-containing protein [Lentisphaerae bacterium]|nr:helicase associated domain-containing protein [Lentisphaerota bacterium]